MTSLQPTKPLAVAPEAARRPDAQPPAGTERRKNPRLCELIDEMLVTVRVAVNRDLWTPEERARAEQDLAGIMRRVREHAIASPH